MALEDAWDDPDPNDEDNPTPLVMTQEQVENSLCTATAVVFPFHALETQKIWMTGSMKEPFDMPTLTIEVALSQTNNI